MLNDYYNQADEKQAKLEEAKLAGDNELVKSLSLELWAEAEAHLDANPEYYDALEQCVHKAN